MGLKDIKKDIIIGAALELFLQRDINSVTIKQIAEHIEVGEATMYRYFANKENIITLCAQKLEKNVFKEYFNLDEFRTGYSKMEEFYNITSETLKTVMTLIMGVAAILEIFLLSLFLH